MILLCTEIIKYKFIHAHYNVFFKVITSGAAIFNYFSVFYRFIPISITHYNIIVYYNKILSI